MSYVLLSVPEGNDPLLTITVQARNPDGTTVPYNLTGAAVTMFIKTNADTADGSAIATISGTVTDALNGVFTVRIATAATAAPGRYFYKINSVLSGHAQTVQYGDLMVTNV
jgi:hypothetical protein